MGLFSAMSTALTGMQASETTIDVVGNNLANANTIGFKASTAFFATQFLQTLSLGSQPTLGAGGTNPRQVGLGTLVAAITPNFNQGTIEISSNPLDMAIQGEGFFVVEGSQGEHLYSRNGVFQLNAENELVSITGNRLLGYGVDENFEIQRSVLESIDLSLRSVAQATSGVFFEGTLTPTGELADTAEQIQTDILGDASFSAPAAGLTSAPSAAPNILALGWQSQLTGGGSLAPGDYEYRLVYANGAYPGFPAPIPPLSEGTPSDVQLVTVAAGDDAFEISSLPTSYPDGIYDHVRIYRRAVGGPTTDFQYVDQVLMGASTSYIDTGAGPLGPVLDETVLNGQYSYYVTFERAGIESRPSPISSPNVFNGGRAVLMDIPIGDPTEWTSRRIYRNLADDDSTFHLVAEIPDVDQPVILTDNLSDSQITANPTLDFEGPRIDSDTLLTDVLRRDGGTYEQIFQVGTLQFTGRKGDRTLDTKELEITATSNVLDLIGFMEDALGIQRPPGPDPAHIIPFDAGSGSNPGGRIDGGRIVLTANNGEGNAIDIGLSGLLLETGTGTENVNLPFGVLQNAVGESAIADFLAYDSLGIPVRVRVTAVMESRDSTSTTYRWFANSPDNSPDSGSAIAVGTGLMTFDGAGNLISTTDRTVSIARRSVSSASPLEFELDFTAVSGLADDRSTLAVSRQDGSPKGDLTSFIISEDGVIRGVFSNGVARDLGQLQLARFANPAGLEQQGRNLFSEGINSGLPVQSDPGEQGAGTIIAGAVELSNTDIGTNLIDLILASTMYRANTRVITTTQEMIDELLALRR